MSQLLGDVFDLVMTFAIFATLLYVPFALVRWVIRKLARTPHLEQEVQQLRAEVEELRRGDTAER